MKRSRLAASLDAGYADMLVAGGVDSSLRDTIEGRLAEAGYKAYIHFSGPQITFYAFVLCEYPSAFTAQYERVAIALLQDDSRPVDLSDARHPYARDSTEERKAVFTDYMSLDVFNEAIARAKRDGLPCPDLSMRSLWTIGSAELLFALYPDAHRHNPHIMRNLVHCNRDCVVDIARDCLTASEQTSVIDMALLRESATSCSPNRMRIIKGLVELGATASLRSPSDNHPYMLYYDEVLTAYRLRVSKAVVPHLGTNLADTVADFF